MTIDLTGLKVLVLADIEAAIQKGATEVVTLEDAVLTPSAREALQVRGVAVRSGSAAAPSSKDGGMAASDHRIAALFDSPEARAVKEEICAVGKKLWLRSYVDGNGGNISCRIGPNEVICTPTLCSKYDLTPDKLCLVDLAGKQLAGGRPRTSEILLHLEIYKEVPEAKAVVHCHPPHATAYAISGKVPPTCIIPEYEVFIGKVALSPYETPGTSEFARTVLPFVRTHNSVLLANHGIVCWGDTVTHAEWYAEVLDTYCWTLLCAQQIGGPTFIADAKAADLLAIKQKLGLPDPRHEDKECQICDVPDTPNTIAMAPRPCLPGKADVSTAEMERLVQEVTEQVMAALAKTK
ncbi:MAG TPA: class II aldolase/adducin family protein [Verrucomicrobiae bacterium]|nr:class II aldolase/adducin family protein [Verrucomicrobiae bacterium]